MADMQPSQWRCGLSSCEEPAAVVVNNNGAGVKGASAGFHARSCARHETAMWEYIRTEYGLRADSSHLAIRRYTPEGAQV